MDEEKLKITQDVMEGIFSYLDEDEIVEVPVPHGTVLKKVNLAPA